VPYEQQIKIMQQSRVMPYGGTWPAPYTLSFIEAMMTGLPIVAISKTLAHYPQYEAIDFYEVDEILAEIGGLVCDSEGQMIGAVQRLLHDPSHALDISKKQRSLAIRMFGKKEIS
jgi:glycosyltransferase involved in cell wall biosynthesis